MSRMNILTLALALGPLCLAAPAPAPIITDGPSTTTTSCTTSLCTTYTNDCGNSYGGCYLDPNCGGTLPVWHPPPCPVTQLSARDAAPSPTCSTSTCATYTNACSATFGGCYLDPACGGTEPVWHPPPCTVLDARAIPTPPPTAVTTATCSTSTCATYTNACSATFGGCYLDPACGGTEPVWHPPLCTVLDARAIPTPPPAAVTTATCSTSTCATYTNACSATYGGCYLDPACGGTEPVWHPPLCTVLDARAIPTPPPTTTTATCSTSTCVTYTNACSASYGGCYLDPACGGTAPVWNPPLCPVTDVVEPTITAPPISTPSSTTTCDYSRCVDYINSCGQTYGGCFLDPACGGTIPVFHEPLCTTTVSASSSTRTVGAGCPYAECVTSVNACGAALTTCFLASACGGTSPPVQTSTCTRDWTSDSTTMVITSETSSSTTTTV